MEKMLNVAKALYDMYYEQSGTHMDEMKMHKLMYFAQRESLMYNDEPLFEGAFYGWKYGPVLKEVRSEYHYYSSAPFANVVEKVSEGTLELLRSVMKQYGSLSSWDLSRLSHEEFSWKKARKGLESGEDGDVKLSLDAMKVDAMKELVARKVATV